MVAGIQIAAVLAVLAWVVGSRTSLLPFSPAVADELSGVEVVSIEQSTEYLVESYGLSEAEARQRLFRSPAYSEVMERLNSDLRGSFESAYGGAWIDHRGEGQMVIAATDSAVADRLADTALGIVRDIEMTYGSMDLTDVGISEVEAREFSLPIEARVVPNSLAELSAIRNNLLSSVLLIDSDLRFVEMYISEIDNSLIVELATDSPDNVRNLVRDSEIDVGPAMVVRYDTFLSDDRGEAACPTDLDCSPRGAKYFSSRDGRCSIGFSGTRNGVRGLYTAGHCLDYSRINPDYPYSLTLYGPYPMTMAFNTIGRYSWPYYPNTPAQDYAFATYTQHWAANGAHGYIWTPTDPMLPVSGVLNRSAAVAGDVVCRSGYRTEDDHLFNHCGILQSVFVYPEVPGNAAGAWGRLYDTSPCPGDSGGPIYREIDGKALGTISRGSVDNGCDGTLGPDPKTLFTWQSDALADLGGTLDVGK